MPSALSARSSLTRVVSIGARVFDSQWIACSGVRARNTRRPASSTSPARSHSSRTRSSSSSTEGSLRRLISSSTICCSAQRVDCGDVTELDRYHPSAVGFALVAHQLRLHAQAWSSAGSAIVSSSSAWSGGATSRAERTARGDVLDHVVAELCSRSAIIHFHHSPELDARMKTLIADLDISRIMAASW